jgi:hypothetical protein
MWGDAKTRQAERERTDLPEDADVGHLRDVVTVNAIQREKTIVVKSIASLMAIGWFIIFSACERSGLGQEGV